MPVEFTKASLPSPPLNTTRWTTPAGKAAWSTNWPVRRSVWVTRTRSSNGFHQSLPSNSTLAWVEVASPSMVTVSRLNVMDPVFSSRASRPSRAGHCAAHQTAGLPPVTVPRSIREASSRGRAFRDPRCIAALRGGRGLGFPGAADRADPRRSTRERNDRPRDPTPCLPAVARVVPGPGSGPGHAVVRVPEVNAVRADFFREFLRLAGIPRSTCARPDGAIGSPTQGLSSM